MRPPRSRRSALLATVLANAVPLVGIAVWDWSVGTLVLLYWVELAVLISFASIRALFAQRPAEFEAEQVLFGAFRDKYGGFSVPNTGIKIRVQSIVSLVGLPILGLLWLLVGSFALVGVSASTTGELPGVQSSTLVVGVLGLVVSHLYLTIEYFVEEEYEKVNAQMVVASAFWPLGVTGLAMVVGGGVAATAGSPLSLLGGIVATKFCLDLVSVYRDRLRAFDESQSLDLGLTYDPPERPSVDESFAGPFEVVRPHRRAALASGVVRGCHSLVGLMFLVLFSLAATGFFALGGTTLGLTFGALVGVVVAIMVVAGVTDHTIRYLSMEYRVGVGDSDVGNSGGDRNYDDNGDDGESGESAKRTTRAGVVGYDRLLDEPSWRLSKWEVTNATTERSRVDRFFGTETLVVERGDETVRLAHVPETSIVTD
ncbi:DUF6498-containing protein [Haloprofundus marisrubri]|nr:DUF6498-containing protein [Haloprofundus marisrubri]